MTRHGGRLRPIVLKNLARSRIVDHLRYEDAISTISAGIRQVGRRRSEGATARLLEEMEIAHADGSLAKLRNQLAKTSLLILDDFGLIPLPKRGLADLLEVLDDRIGADATIVAGQMPVQDWHAFIHAPALADAIMDRLIYSSYKVALQSDSMRKTRAVKSAR